jgi:hypothetical protein
MLDLSLKSLERSATGGCVVSGDNGERELYGRLMAGFGGGRFSDRLDSVISAGDSDNFSGPICKHCPTRFFPALSYAEPKRCVHSSRKTDLDLSGPTPGKCRHPGNGDETKV